jgi:very-short-patch-repair endonuclease
MINYLNLTDDKKREILVQEYENNKKSFQDIAEKYGTYANKIRRDAKKLKIKIRDKSEAQKNALSTGKSNHPTEGKQRSDSTKQKIGLSVMNSWENLDEKELNKRREKARLNWEKLPEHVKQNRLHEANLAVRESSKKGSKLEIYLLNSLIENGYKVEFHKEQILSNTKLQIDLFLPRDNIAIEIDGPSHFEPVWGQDVLKRNKKYDNTKTGLLLGKNIRLIRIKQTKDFSKSRGMLVFSRLMEAIADMDNSKKNYIQIGD